MKKKPEVENLVPGSHAELELGVGAALIFLLAELQNYELYGIQNKPGPHAQLYRKNCRNSTSTFMGYKNYNIRIMYRYFVIISME
jgi:hypothetical protein